MADFKDLRDLLSLVGRGHEGFSALSGPIWTEKVSLFFGVFFALLRMQGYS